MFRWLGRLPPPARDAHTDEADATDARRLGTSQVGEFNLPPSPRESGRRAQPSDPDSESMASAGRPTAQIDICL